MACHFTLLSARENISTAKLTLTAQLGPDEKAWISENHTVHVRIVDFPPYMIVGNGEPTGLVVDYLKLVSEQTGVQFEFVVSTQAFAQSIQELKNLVGFDLIPGKVFSEKENLDISYTKPFHISSTAIFTQTNAEFISSIDDLTGRKIVVEGGTVLAQTVADDYPFVELIHCNDVNQGIQMLAEGQADAFIDNLTVTSFLIQKYGLTDIRVAAPSPLPEQSLAFGARKDWPELSSIINKVLANISPEERSAMLGKYLSLQYDHGIRTEDVRKWALMIGFPLLIILLLILLGNRTLKRRIKRITAEVKEREKQFRATFEQAAVGIAHVSPAGIFLRLNQKFCDIVGYTHKEMLELTFQDITHADDLNMDLKEVQQLLDNKNDNYSIEKRYIRNDDSIVWVNLTVSILYQNYEPEYFIAVIEEITDKKEAENELKESEEKFRGLMDQAPYAISIVNPDGRIDQVNQAFMKLWGFTEEAWPEIKANYNFLKDPEAIRLGTMSLIEKAFKGEIVELPLVEYISKNTTDNIGIETMTNRRWIQVRLYPIKNSNGDIVKVVDVAENITSTKLAENKLKQSEKDFRDLVEQNPLFIEIYNPEGQLIHLNNAYKNLLELDDDLAQLLYTNYNLFEDEYAIEHGLGSGIKNVFAGDYFDFHEFKFDIDLVRSWLALENLNKGKLWFKTAGFPIKDENGDIKQVVFLSQDVSSRVTAEQGLKEARSFTDHLIDTANVIIVGLDAQGNVNLFNPAAEQITGYTLAELQGKNWFEILVPKEKYPKVHKEFNRLMEQGDTSLFQNPILTKNGQERYISWSNSTIQTRDEVQGILSFGQDITEQKQAENKIRVSEENYRTLIEQANDGVVVIQDGLVKFVNSALTKITGFSSSELIDSHFLNYIEKSDLEKVKANYAKRMKGDLVPPYESRIVKKNSEIIDVEFNGGLTYYAGGIADLVMVRDIAERKKAIETRDKLFNLSQDLIAIASLDTGRFIYVNEAWHTVLGYSTEKLISKSIFDFIHPDDHQKTHDEIESLKSGKNTVDFEDRFLHKEGYSMDFSWAATPLLEERLFYAIGRDITERKKVDAQILQYQDRLKDQAIELTLAEERQRKQIAIDLHDQVGQLLASSRMQLATLNNNMDKVEILEESKSISLGLKEAIQTTRSLIFDLSPPQLNEIGLFAATDDWLDEQIEQKYGIKTSLTGDDIIYPLDDNLRMLLFRSIRELLLNVVKHAKATSVKVDMKLEDSVLILVVKDNGIGFNFNPELLKLKSSGFGLFSIFERIEDLSGEVNLNSIPGEGTTINIEVPLITIP